MHAISFSRLKRHKKCLQVRSIEEEKTNEGIHAKIMEEFPQST